MRRMRIQLWMQANCFRDCWSLFFQYEVRILNWWSLTELAAEYVVFRVAPARKFEIRDNNLYRGKYWKRSPRRVHDGPRMLHIAIKCLIYEPMESLLVPSDGAKLPALIDMSVGSPSVWSVCCLNCFDICSIVRPIIPACLGDTVNSVHVYFWWCVTISIVFSRYKRPQLASIVRNCKKYTISISLFEASNPTFINARAADVAVPLFPTCRHGTCVAKIIGFCLQIEISIDNLYFFYFLQVCGQVYLSEGRIIQACVESMNVVVKLHFTLLSAIKIELIQAPVVLAKSQISVGRQFFHIVTGISSKLCSL